MVLRAGVYALMARVLLFDLTFIMHILLKAGVKLTFGLTSIPVPVIDLSFDQSNDQSRSSFSPDKDSISCTPCPCMCVS